MSTHYKHGDHVPTAVLAKRLDELSDVIGQPGEERDRELTRRIPAELDRDADLVLSEAAQRLLKMEAERDVLAAHLDQAEEEREYLQTQYHLMASEMVYEGNSVQHWRQKALAYKECAGAISDLKQIMGVNGPAETVGAVKALAAHVERLSRAAYEVCNDSFSYGGTSMAVNAAGDLATGDRGKYPCSMTALAEAAISGPTTSLARLKAQWQAEVLERLRELLQETHMDKSPSVSRAAMHVDDAINRVKQECKPLELRRQAEEITDGR